MSQLQPAQAAARNFYKQYGGSAPENYERYFVPAIGRPNANDLIEVAELRPGERVLDVACGTGLIARLAAERVGKGGQVTGVDINPGMLAVARQVAPSASSIEWHESSAEAMSLPDSTFDVVICQLGLQFFQDKLAALRNMRRVLAPGGRVILGTVGPRPAIFGIFEAALARHVSPDLSVFIDLVFSLHDASALHELVSSAGFSDVVVRTKQMTLALPPPEKFLWEYFHSTPLASALPKLTDDVAVALEREVVKNWQEFVRDGALILELRVLQTTARR